MLKKMIALLTIFAMVLPLSPVVAADEPSAQPTIEEILNGYHQKAFEQQNSEEFTTASAQSRTTGSSKTLEQETVEELTAAGYEAYNVTGENYSALEETLRTDFGDMGLDPNGSYIIVISGEENDTANSGMSPRGGDLILPPHIWDDTDHGGGNFIYTENGVTYTMRYVTIASTDHPSLHVQTGYALSNAMSLWDLFLGVADIGIAVYVDYKVRLPVSTVASLGVLFYEYITDDGLELLDPETIILYATTRWTRSYIQVYNNEKSAWHTSQCSSFAYTQAYCVAGYTYNEEAGQDEPAISENKTWTTYSPFYQSPSTRKSRAVRGYLAGGTLYDFTGNINFCFANSEGITFLNENNEPLFIHQEDTSYILPLIQED